MSHKCAKCGRPDVRLYRPYGECPRMERIVCIAHFPIPTNLGWWVPLRFDEHGNVYGYCGGDQASVDAWMALADSDPSGPTYKRNEDGDYEVCQ